MDIPEIDAKLLRMGDWGHPFVVLRTVNGCRCVAVKTYSLANALKWAATDYKDQSPTVYHIDASGGWEEVEVK